MEILRRSEELDNLERDQQNLDKTDVPAVRRMRDRCVAMLHRLENELP